MTKLKQQIAVSYSQPMIEETAKCCQLSLTALIMSAQLIYEHNKHSITLHR